jgi:serine/threonine-protein kinase RsbW
MTVDVEKKFGRNFNSIDSIYKFISEFFNRNNIAESNSYATNLAIEEVFTNMVKYDADNANDISIGLKMHANNLIIILTDYDVEKFDITGTPQVDINQPLQERKRGGLGLLLVHKIMDKIEYEYKNRTSIITLTKTLESDHV